MSFPWKRESIRKLASNDWIPACAGMDGVNTRRLYVLMKRATAIKEPTKAFALRIIRLYSALPNTSVAQVLGRQILRSGTSVGAHYREAYRARSTAEFVSKLNGGLQELEETTYWLELLSEAEILETNPLKPLLQETQELIAIFVTLIKNAKTKSLKPSS